MKVFVLISAVFLAAGLLAPCLHAQSPSRVEAERLFVEAQKSLARGDDVKAEDYLKKALKNDATFTSAIWQMSQIYEKRGQLEYARELLLRGLQQEPDATWARDKLKRMEKTLTTNLLREAERLMAAGKYDLAIPKLSLYLGIKPYDPVPLVQIARCHLAMDNIESAKEYLVQASERDPTNTEVIALLDEVERRFDKAEVEAALSRARQVLASYTYETKDRAEKALSDVLKLDPENTWARDKLREIALLEEEEQKLPPAEEAVAKSVEKVDKAIKTLEEPTSRAISVLRSNVLILVLVIIAGLLALNLKRRRKSRSYPLQGSLSLIPILDIVSLLNSNLKSGRLMIVSQSGRGEVFFEKGEIIHARLKSWDGKSAFHKIMALRSGRYTFSNHLPSVRHTITEPLSLLLLSMRSMEQEPKRESKKPTVKKTVPKREEIFK
jgi:tetratricopeptide (TPR) repeat protein